MYESLKKRFTDQFGTKPGFVFSAPGRTEIGGNHTDHQHGCVLAGAVNLDTVAAVARSERGAIRVLSEGYPLCEVSLSELEAVPAEAGTTKALIRGIAARFAALGHAPVAFDAYVTSTVLPGSGLSSSAAFEVLIGVILNHLGSCGLDGSGDRAGRPVCRKRLLRKTLRLDGSDGLRRRQHHRHRFCRSGPSEDPARRL